MVRSMDQYAALYADEIARLRSAMEKAIKIIDTNHNHQREKVKDAASVLRAALNPQ